MLPPSFYLSLWAVFLPLFFSNIAYATLKNSWSPYWSLDGGISAQRIQNVDFDNPRQPQLVQNSNNSAVGFGSFALGTYVTATPIHVELRATFYGQNNFNREYFFPSFFSAVGIQKLKIQSNHLMVRGYYNIPFEKLTPYLSLGAGASWNKTTATQYAPQFPGWIYHFMGTTQTNFVWSAGVGLTKSLQENLMLNVGYNFVALGKFDTGVLPYTGDEHIVGQLHSNELSVGFTYLV